MTQLQTDYFDRNLLLSHIKNDSHENKKISHWQKIDLFLKIFSHLVLNIASQKKQSLCKIAKDHDWSQIKPHWVH